jgi:hypothetical protein
VTFRFGTVPDSTLIAMDRFFPEGTHTHTHTYAHTNKHTGHTSPSRLDEVQEISAPRSFTSTITPTVKPKKKSSRRGSSAAPSPQFEHGEQDRYWREDADAEPVGGKKTTGQFTPLTAVEQPEYITQYCYPTLHPFVI